MNVGKNVIRFWGLCDMTYVLFYIGWSISKFHVPLYHELAQSLENTQSLESPVPLFIAGFGVILHISLIFSGWLLFRLRVLGAVISYLQTPLRLVLVLPSLFFVNWPLSFLLDHPPLIAGMVLILLSEIFKVLTVVIWQRSVGTQVVDHKPE